MPPKDPQPGFSAFFSAPSSAPPPYAHQEETIAFHSSRPAVLDASDPGTGKTRSVIEFWRSAKKAGRFRGLVFAPKSILVSSWLEDLRRFAPELSAVVARAEKRAKAFNSTADIVITNHDAVKWVAKNIAAGDFTHLAIDEITAYKNPSSDRSKAARIITPHFEHRIGMSGSLTPNTILEMWHPVMLLDDGERLGDRYFAFRQEVCTPVAVGYHVKAMEWHDKPGAREAVADILRDMTIRHKFEECLTVPENSLVWRHVPLAPRHKQMYEQFAKQELLVVDDTPITAVRAGAVAQKLLQIASGALYDGTGRYKVLDTERYELVTQLVDERECSLVAFNWKHQRDELVRQADLAGFVYAVIDSEASDKERTRAVQDYQAGKLRVIYAHPACAAHGLTLTRGTTTIWPSPTFNVEHFQQFNRRQYRAGQTKKTETILVCAPDTAEVRAYDRLMGKQDDMQSFLGLIHQLRGDL